VRRVDDIGDHNIVALAFGPELDESVALDNLIFGSALIKRKSEWFEGKLIDPIAKFFEEINVVLPQSFGFDVEDIEKIAKHNNADDVQNNHSLKI
jgi:hypothetical protein